MIAIVGLYTYMFLCILCSQCILRTYFWVLSARVQGNFELGPKSFPEKGKSNKEYPKRRMVVAKWTLLSTHRADRNTICQVSGRETRQIPVLSASLLRPAFFPLRLEAGPGLAPALPWHRLRLGPGPSLGPGHGPCPPAGALQPARP